PWLLAMRPGDRNAGGYLRISNTGEQRDRLVGGTLEHARGFELRDKPGSDHDRSGPVAAQSIEIAPRQTVELKPGGAQVVGLDMQRLITTGQRISGTLLFERSGAVTIQYAVPLVAASPHAPAIGSSGAPFELIDQWGRPFSST